MNATNTLFDQAHPLAQQKVGAFFAAEVTRLADARSPRALLETLAEHIVDETALNLTALTRAASQDEGRSVDQVINAVMKGYLLEVSRLLESTAQSIATNIAGKRNGLDATTRELAASTPRASAAGVAAVRDSQSLSDEEF